MRLPTARDSHYRRGAIMGLTAAEAFMLICFVLLLIIALWQRQSLDRLKAVNEQLKQATAFQNSFTESQRLAAITYKDALEQLGHSLQKVRTFEELLAEAGGEAEFRETLQTLRDIQNVPPEEVVDRVRLLDDLMLRQIAQATSELPDETRRKLSDLSKEPEFASLVDVAHRAPESFSGALDRLAEFEALGLTAKEIKKLAALATEVDGLTEEVTAFRASGLTPNEAKRLSDAVDQLRNADAQSGADIAAEIRARAGNLIAEMGGNILDNGSVTFPEGVLFDPGKSSLKPEFDRVLSRFCRPWLEVLRDFDTALRNVQIEGHASSEWNDATPPVAFINNLGLSQARAATVFQRCLDYVGTDELGTWARTRLAAVGYSSSRPVLTVDKSEDRERSRRVVFALDVKTADDLLIEEFVSDSDESAGQTAPPAAAVPSGMTDVALQVTSSIDGEGKGYQKLEGLVEAVVDGDTLFVGPVKIRLQGLHAPELSDLKGREAKVLLQNAILGKKAICWMTGGTTFDRDEGICVVDGLDVATLVISNGMGRDCPAFSNGRYQPLEAAVEYEAVLVLPDYCTM